MHRISELVLYCAFILIAVILEEMVLGEFSLVRLAEPSLMDRFGVNLGDLPLVVLFGDLCDPPLFDLFGALGEPLIDLGEPLIDELPLDFGLVEGSLEASA